MLPLTRFSSIGGIALTPLISMRNKQMNWWYAPGNAVSATIEAIVRNQRAVMRVSTLLDGEYGHRDVCIGVPCVLGSKGDEEIIELKLKQKETEIFSNGVRSIKYRPPLRKYVTVNGEDTPNEYFWKS